MLLHFRPYSLNIIPNEIYYNTTYIVRIINQNIEVCICIHVDKFTEIPAMEMYSGIAISIAQYLQKALS